MSSMIGAAEVQERHDDSEAVRPHYLESLRLVERLHRRLLDVIKDEFERNGRSDVNSCLLYTSPSPRDRQKSRMPSSA